MQGKAGALLIVLVMTLTGCIGGANDAPIDDQNVTTQGGLPQNATVAPDGRGEISAFKETNATEQTMTGSVMHAHDYWQGKERLDSVAWIDAGLIPIPLTPCNKPDHSCTLGGTTPGGSDTYPPLTTIADFDLGAPPRMGMIYEGTKEVELVMNTYTGPCRRNPTTSEPVCSPPNPAGKVFFDYLAANDEPGKFRKGGELKFNEPFRIPIEPTDADMPHQTKSLWIFRIYSNTEMVWFDFNITINLIKGYDVVDWPPHPDLYANRPDRVVFEQPVKLASKGSVDSFIFGSDAGWISPEKVISWGTERVEITITDVKFTGQLPIPPTGYDFEFRNASTPFLMANGVAYGGKMKDPSSDGTTYHFTIDLTQDRGEAYDTPYAQYSRWGFRLVPTWDDGSGCIDELFFPGILFGCQWYPWEMTYNMKIVAYGKSTAGGAPETFG